MTVKNQDTDGNEQDAYEYDPYLVVLKGSRTDMGRDFAALVGDEVKNCYDHVLSNAGIGFAQQQALQLFLDNQWNGYLSKQVPQDFLDELEGMKKEKRSVYNVITRIIVIANLPSDLPEDMLPVLADEKANGADMMKSLEEHEGWAGLKDSLKKFKAAQCSMMATWGQRTAENQLFSGRNLDYVSNMGVNPWKSIIIWIPDSSSTFNNPHPHAAFGYLALYGSLSGMSKAGITVHEANLEEKNETFRGFPWVLRLRYIMEGASNLQEGIKLWKETNNTVGYNHMIAYHPFGSDAAAAWAMETAANYTAYFQDMDPREQSCMVNNESVGFPLPDALWRTNHPYDPALMNDYLWWGTSAYSSSQQRYMIAHDTILSYEENDVVIDYIQAINLTANVADKGMNSPYKCEFPYASEHGSNILSVTHQPQAGLSWVAWDNGEGDSWSPACCNTYVKFDFNSWW
eukprot:CAMPEP_0201508122 /NCGR_PEP_ID=MMETSP0161_2-20130828/1571_1 /ASSEMBLY_ACC=CAM_ASM_000251 /TAXON_ID=180227 /ORGANISM="Neoparamoeba aestuarina, Strain SoJaBio B1-5/56/2" /LENGTH=457 /DNA_ID=CAMNT_0047902679 /DNA_START=184 /DNA_END=1560 /DNA_ORIENTATION=+